MFRKPKKLGIFKKGLVGLIAGTAGILSCSGNGSTPTPPTPPEIISTPVESIVVNNLYSYDVDAQDVNGDVLTYDLDANSKLKGMGIDPDTGLITWDTFDDDLGSHSVTVSVDDGGFIDEQSFDLLVRSQLEDVVGKYVIVTSPALAPNFEALRVWKANKGYDAEIITIEDIIASESGRDTPEKIRKRLKKIKNANLSKDVYVLLGGDVEVVPHRQVYAECSLGAPFSPDYTVPCDLYFSDLDGDWDGDLDDVFGETNDGNGGSDIDLHPDVFVGRAPVNTSGEVTDFVDKVLDYEQVPDVDYIKNVLFCAAKVDIDTDSAIAKDWINPNVYDFAGNGYTLKRLYETGYNGADLEGKVNVMNALNAGYHIVNIDGHGSESSINVGGLENINSDGFDPEADIRDLVNSLSTSRNSIIYSLGCHSNAFDTEYGLEDCIGEYFINNSKGGGVAFIGGSRIGLVFMDINNPNPNQGDGISFRYDRRFVESLFTNNKNNLGKAFGLSKDYYSEKSKQESGDPYWEDYRWIQLCLNLLGDPEMVVWKDNLGTLTANTIPQTGYTEVNVDDGVNPVKGAKVCLNDGINVYSALSDVNGKVVIPVSGSVTTTVTKKDWLPYVQ